MKALLEEFYTLRDPAYRDFHKKLIPNVDPDRILGVRTPEIRKFAKKIYGTPEAEEFLQTLPHFYYDENNLHGALIERIRDFDACLQAVETFLPYVDNWATCDLLAPKALKKDPARLELAANRFLDAEHPYTVRFGIGLFLRYFLNGNFKEDSMARIAAIRSDEYYINMMIAWYFATALCKQKEAALPYLTEKKLPKWIHNKAIQKAVESYRIPAEEKACYRTLKIK